MADINFEDIQPYVEGQGDSGLTARQKIKRNFEKVKSFLLRLVGQISFLQRTKADVLDTEEEGVFFTNEKGEVFLKFNSNGLDTSEVSDHLKSLLAQDLSEYAKLTDIPEQLEVIKTTEEDGIYFTDGQGNVFIKYDNVNGLDVNKVSEHLKSLIIEGLIIPSDSPIKDIDEDIVSLVTNKNGESAVLWSNKYGLNVNKVNYYLNEKIRNAYIKDMEEWFKLGTGMFIHWGVYSVLGGHYEGLDIDGNYINTDVNSIAEWIINTLKIPDATYKAYQSQFTAANWDADLVANMAYECGLKYIIITAKHHEGFTLYDSQYANWDIKSSGANGKDPLMELKKACEKYGLKFCLYFSQVRDWIAEGGFGQSYKTGSDPYTESQHFAYIDMTVNILKEMIGKYNPYVLWYDGPDADDKYSNVLLQSQLVNYPQVIVNWRLQKGYKVGDFATGEGSYFSGDRNVWKYAENCYTINGSWGYSIIKDDASAINGISDVIGRCFLQSKCRDQNVLINISPKGDGEVPTLTQNLFSDLGAWIRKYGTFDNTHSPNIHSFPNWGRMLIKGNTLKLFVCDGSETVSVDGILTKFVKNVRVYDTVGSNGEYSEDNYTIMSDHRLSIVNIPSNAETDRTPAVVDVEFGSNIISDVYSNILDDNNLRLTALAFDGKDATVWVHCWHRWPEAIVSGFRIGGWKTSSAWIETYFKYEGTTANYNISAKMPNGSSDVIVTGVLTDMKDGSVQSFTFSKPSNGTIGNSVEEITLTSGKVYKMRCTHNGAGSLELSYIDFVN